MIPSTAPVHGLVRCRFPKYEFVWRGFGTPVAFLKLQLDAVCQFDIPR
ncbi:hypothetical protein RISK_005538 [Rhodopirellula islandica]|uniref:Uncharacterized protein n=1 Tax=Rhodopirellula islandica TaxID=595434 RepID=A0A0J1B6X0_RHOIS|nr:hypothetical protein RISK_005538 [Rhodopirellula islandica]